MPKSIIIKEPKYNLTSPEQMTGLAKVLRSHIEKNNLFTNISDKSYAHVEGWQFAGGLMGLFPIVREVTDLSKGAGMKWSAKVEIVNISTDKVVGVGYALCSNTENKKKSFDEYAILSMAQTRAIGKAYRNMLGWVMKMAGYEGTPSEEIIKMGEKVTVAKVEETFEDTKYTCAKCDAPCTEQEAQFSKKRFGKVLCREHQEKALAVLKAKKGKK